MLDEVRDLRRQADQITRETNRLRANVRARMSWDPQVPSLPSEQREIADRVVDLLSTPRLSSAQGRQLQRAFYGR